MLSFFPFPISSTSNKSRGRQERILMGLKKMRFIAKTHGGANVAHLTPLLQPWQVYNSCSISQPELSSQSVGWLLRLPPPCWEANSKPSLSTRVKPEILSSFVYYPILTLVKLNRSVIHSELISISLHVSFLLNFFTGVQLIYNDSGTQPRDSVIHIYTHTHTLSDSLPL